MFNYTFIAIKISIAIKIGESVSPKYIVLYQRENFDNGILTKFIFLESVFPPVNSRNTHMSISILNKTIY